MQIQFCINVDLAAFQLLESLGRDAGAQWATVRIMDGYNELNTAGRAVGWMLLTGAVFGVGLMIPLALAQVLALGVWAVAMLAINFRAYDLGVLKSIVAIPMMLLISFGLQFVLCSRGDETISCPEWPHHSSPISDKAHTVG